MDWSPGSHVSKAGRRHPSLNTTGEEVYSYQNLSSAAVLREVGHKVDYLHCSTQGLSVSETKDRIETLKPKILVIMVEHINRNVTQALSLHAKEQGTQVVWVGPFATALHETLIEESSVDFIFRGEWDYAIRELADHLSHKKPEFGNVPGLTWKDSKGKTKVNEPRQLISDLDQLPIPAYDLLDLGKFYESVFIKYPAATMITSRGCPFHCVYCSYPQTIYSHKFRPMSPRRVVDEIRYLVEDRGVKEIRIDDDTFNIDSSRVIEICRILIEEKIKTCFSVQVRPQLLTDEQARWLKKAGCRMVLFGVESGNDEILKKIRKGTTKDEIRRGVKIAKRHGLDVLNCVMIGFYWDTKETIEETIQFACELNAEFNQFSTPTPLPGTEYYQLLKTSGCFLTEEWEKHDSFHHSSVQLPNVTNEELNRVFKTCYRRYYRRPAYVGMMLSRMFRSWGNFKQSMRKAYILFTK